MPEHKYAAILRAIADGKTMQFRGSENLWYEADADSLLQTLSAGVYQPDRFRIKPETILINGHEVPRPERFSPAIGTKYWIPNINAPEVSSFNWACDGRDALWLSRGLVHLAKDAAEAHARALLSFTSREVVLSVEGLP